MKLLRVIYNIFILVIIRKRRIGISSKRIIIKINKNNIENGIKISYRTYRSRRSKKKRKRIRRSKKNDRKRKSRSSKTFIRIIKKRRI